MAKPEVCSEKAITEGDFAWLFHRYWNGNEVHVNSNVKYDVWEKMPRISSHFMQHETHDLLTLASSYCKTSDS